MELVEVHLGIFVATMIAIVWADHGALAYMRGTKPTLNATRIQRLHWGIGAGVLGMILTGALMVYPSWSFYASDPVFQLKMAFVGVLVINGMFIGTLMHVATQAPFAQLSSSQKTKLFMSGGASATGWIGAFIIGMFFL